MVISFEYTPRWWGRGGKLTDEERKTALKAAKPWACRFVASIWCGASGGPLVLEVNSSASIKTPELITGRKCPRKIVNIEQNAASAQKIKSARDYCRRAHPPFHFRNESENSLHPLKLAFGRGLPYFMLMNVAAFIVVIALSISTLAYVTKRRFGVLAVSNLLLDQSLSTLWARKRLFVMLAWMCKTHPNNYCFGWRWCCYLL